MCTVNIKIDNEKVRRINPNLKNNENIERWVQYCMDEFIDTLSSNGHKSVSPNAEAGEEKLISNTKGEQGTGTCPSLENQQVA